MGLEVVHAVRSVLGVVGVQLEFVGAVRGVLGVVSLQFDVVRLVCGVLGVVAVQLEIVCVVFWKVSVEPDVSGAVGGVVGKVA